MSYIDKVNVGGTLYDVKDSKIIDDTSTSNDSTWSSSKINDELNERSQTNITLTLSDVSTQHTIYKYGKTCHLYIELMNFTPIATANETILGILPTGYRPNHYIDFVVIARNTGNYSTSTFLPVIIEFKSNGQIALFTNNNDFSQMTRLNFGIQWEVI